MAAVGNPLEGVLRQGPISGQAGTSQFKKSRANLRKARSYLEGRGRLMFVGLEREVGLLRWMLAPMEKPLCAVTRRKGHGPLPLAKRL